MQIFLTDTAATPAFQNQAFQVPSAQANQFLVVALEVISLGKNVSITYNYRAPLTLSSMYLQN